jgi:orotate phosphoribosyltransferase
MCSGPPGDAYCRATRGWSGRSPARPWGANRPGPRQLGLRFIFVEKEAGELVLRRGFRIEPGEPLLIVEDVVTKGGRVAETLAIARAHQADVRGIGLLVDRSNGSVDFGVPFHPLIRMKVETFEPDQLPDDLRGSQAVKPGSK